MGDPAVAVLSALGTGTGRYGLDLVRDTGLGSGTLYRTLVRLERSGAVVADRHDSGRRAYRRTVPAPPAPAPPAPVRPRRRAEPRPRRAPWLPAVAVLVAQAYAALSRPAGDRLSDLDVYLGASAGLRSGTSLYDFASAGGDLFTYPPFAGLLFAPLTGLPGVPLAWTLATVLTVVGLAVVVAGRAPAPAVALALAASAPVSSDLRFGQVSLGLAALVALDTVALDGRRYQGVLTGVASAVKLTPLVFVPMLWLAGRRRAAVVAGATFAGCGALAAYLLPADSWRFWTTEVWRVDRIGHLTSTGNQSVNGVLLRLGAADGLRPVLVLAIAGPVAVLALWRAGRRYRDGDPLSATVVVGCAGIALSPVSWTHHQVWLVLAALLPVRGPAWVRYAWPVTVLAVMTLPLAGLGTRLLVALVAAVAPLRRPDPGTVGACEQRVSSGRGSGGSWNVRVRRSI